MRQFVIRACILLCAAPSLVHAQQSDTGEASLVCFLVLLESSFQHAQKCGRSFDSEEQQRYETVRARLEGYIRERGGTNQTFEALRRQLERSAPDCQADSAKVSERFLNEVIDDRGFPARLEDNLARSPDPFTGGCL